jgi:hypothetical protein
MDPLSTGLERAARRARDAVVNFLDTATTSFGRATHYNSRADQQHAELAAHAALLAESRDLYAALLTLPGLTDRSLALGIRSLLKSRSGDGALLAPGVETWLLEQLSDRLPITRLLNLVGSFAARRENVSRVNNARTRRLIARALLGSPSLELWAVKYRRKMRAALTHAWGVRRASVIRAIASRPADRRDDRERRTLERCVGRHARLAFEAAVEAVGFILGAERAWTLPLLRAHREAREDLAAGRSLPLEVLEGIRSTYHPDTPSEALLAQIAPRSLTAGQRLVIQRRATRAGVDVDVDFDRFDAVRLYLYAFEMGLSPGIEQVLDRRARQASERFPMQVGRAGILVDASASMAGSSTQALRPMATALALRDALCAASTGSIVRYAGGSGAERMIRPAGDSCLARPLVELLGEEPDSIFVISDGYENRSAGRFAEVISAARRIGATCAVYHLNPVMAAESRGVRQLGGDRVVTLPVSKPDGLASSLVRAAFDTDPGWAARALVGLTAIEEVTHEIANG